jgi:5'-methylthioadenosine phosphorylase
VSVDVAIIGGTGIYDPCLLENIRVESVDTPFGPVEVKVGVYQEKEVAFLARHGEKHSVPPHLVNYRANIWGLKMLGVKDILATAAVGSLNKQMEPMDFVLLDQFLDFTKSRPQTLVEKGVVHLDMSEPYCAELRKMLVDSAQKMGLRYHSAGTYVCTEGPRFETPAEIRMYKKFDGDVVGMTGVPEVVMAREAGMCYASIAMVTNFAAGISLQKLTHREVTEAVNQNVDKMRGLIFDVITRLDPERKCQCRKMLFSPSEVG